MGDPDIGPNDRRLDAIRRDALRRAGLGLCRCSRSGTVVFLDEQAAAVFGVSPTALAGCALDDLLGESGTADALRAEAAARVATVERLIHPPGAESKWIRIDAYVDREPDAAEDALQLIVCDITEAKHGELRQKRLLERMRHGQKLESLGILAGGIAHEFNNLLMGILGNIEVALLDIESDSPRRECLEDIQAAAQRAATLSGQMLAFSGGKTFTPQAVSLSCFAREMSALLEASVAPHAALVYDVAEEQTWIQADPQQLRQVIVNLVLNASEALGDQAGFIRIATGSLHAAADDLARTFVDDRLPSGRYVTLEVADTGRGMDPKTLEKIFDPFFTTKSSGRGLGLAAVLGIVRSHKGAVRVESVPGQGTTVTVFLPGDPAGETGA